jgi:hypothetical protein
MSVFSLRSRRLSGEFVVHHLPENIRLPNDPSPISGQCAGPRPLLARAHRAIPNEPSKLLKTKNHAFEGVSLFGRTPGPPPLGTTLSSLRLGVLA